MSGFNIKNERLYVDDIPLDDIAQNYGTPTYIYSATHIRAQYTALQDAMRKALPADKQPLLCYACKANTNIAILNILQKLGSGLEIVSEGELCRGLKAGFSADKIISTSFGKNPQEIEACIKAGILQFNIEAPEELENMNETASSMGKVASVVFRLNPDISGGGHSKISTGRKEDKFGNTAEDIIALYKRADKMEHINPVGVSIHIGSQITQVEAFEPGFRKLAKLVKDLRSEGLSVTHLDIGGGFPVRYSDDQALLDLDKYAQWVAEIFLPLDVKIQMEPGRYMVANAGALLTQVEYIKKTPSREFLVLNAGMNDLIRPTLYEAYHGIEPVIQEKGTATKTYDVVGPICESGDIFAKARQMKAVDKGDYVALMSAGAYGFVMASNYNSRPLPAEILVDGDKISVIGKAQSFEDLIARETIPDWL